MSKSVRASEIKEGDKLEIGDTILFSDGHFLMWKERHMEMAGEIEAHLAAFLQFNKERKPINTGIHVTSETYRVLWLTIMCFPEVADSVRLHKTGFGKYKFLFGESKTGWSVVSTVQPNYLV